MIAADRPMDAEGSRGFIAVTGRDRAMEGIGPGAFGDRVIGDPGLLRRDRVALPQRVLALRHKGGRTVVHRIAPRCEIDDTTMPRHEPARMRRRSRLLQGLAGVSSGFGTAVPAEGRQSWPRPASRAETIACARLSTPSLEKTVLT